MEGISKSYPQIPPLRRVDFDVIQGEVHGLAGVAGSGKSTLVRILAGIFPPDEGSIYLDGNKVHFRSPSAARAAGIGVLLQDKMIITSLTVAENILIGRQPVNKFGMIKISETREQARQALAELGMEEIDPSVTAHDLPRSQQRMVEIATAISLKPRLLVLDDPTSLLTQPEILLLQAAIRRLKSNTGIVYISDQLDEFFSICDRITVLRGGEKRGTFQVHAVSRNELIYQIVGRDPHDDLKPRPKRDYSGRTPILQVEHLSDGDEVRDASFSVFPGEILAIIGQVGAGHTQIGRAFFGMSAPTEGKVLYDGQPVRIRSPLDALAHGIAYLPADRPSALHYQQLAITLHVLAAKKNPLWKLVSRHAYLLQVADVIREHLNGSTPAELRTDEDPLINVQPRRILSHWAVLQPQLLFIEEPAIGVDIATQVEILASLQTLADQGTAVVIVATHLGEIGLIAERTVSYRNGRISRDLLG